ncbi:MAG: cell division protein FtsW [Ruminococcaceae bacterium]|nr:cell division protein FtsW [Oscillospiraceae bacterium]
MKKLNLFSKKKKRTEILPVANSGELSVTVRPEETKKHKKTEDTPLNSKIYISEHGFDRPMLIIILLISLFGLIMVYSSSYVYALTYHGNSAYFVMRQALFLALGIMIMLFMTRFGYKIIKIFTVPAFIAAVILLVAVLFVGTSEGEAQRWIFIGPVSFQPSEFMKIAMILMIARISSKYKLIIHSKRKFWKSTWLGFVLPGIIIAVSCALVLLEKHLSGTIILFLIGFSLLWTNGSPKFWSIFFTVVGLGAIFFVVYAVNQYPEEVKELVPDYMFVRVDSWLHPENYDQLGDLWQTIQGKIAVGSGGFFGRGFGKSLQKHLFVSMPQNDFIFAIVCEETGFIGALTVIGLYIAFVVRGLYIAKRAPDVFCSLTATGISVHVGVQAFLNMAVVIGLIPNTGISLPFFSAGGSSLLLLFFEMGLLLIISKYSPVEESSLNKNTKRSERQ